MLTLWVACITAKSQTKKYDDPNDQEIYHLPFEVHGYQPKETAVDPTKLKPPRGGSGVMEKSPTTKSKLTVCQLGE